MSRKWTDSQLQAINASGGSVIVSAAAGSGKTAVLVERVISMITDEKNPVDVDRILVVTYTRAAASELKERLHSKLSALIKKDPYNRNLLRQQSLLGKANISTIHGFCSSIVKEYFYTLNIERNFRIADDGELALIKADALKLTLDSMYASAEPDFFRLVEAFGSDKDDKNLQNIILRIYEFLRSHPYPQWWIKEKLDMFSSFENINESVWYKLIFDYAYDAVGFLSDNLDSTYKYLDCDEYVAECMKDLMKSDSEFVERLKNAIEHPEKIDIRETLDSFYVGTFPRMPGYKDNPIKLKVQSNRAVFKKVVEKLKTLFRFSENECKAQVADLFVISTQLLNCVTQFSSDFQKLKALKKVADFSDLEHWTIELLVDENTKECTEHALNIRTRFDQIMVDEYQDANEAQDLIFTAISNNGENLFFVGDVKQSIYGFRQAMPQLFLEKKNTSELYVEENPIFPAKILLDKNFRSIFGVTDVVNFFFRKLMSESVGDIKYDDTESLKCGAVYDDEKDANVCYHLIDCENEQGVDVSVVEASHIADIISSMISSHYKVKDGDSYRDVTYEDFAVLMRKKGEAPIYVDELISRGIPAFCEVSTTFINSHEIAVMTAFLSVIDNPALDIELLTVLMSPIFGFTPDDMARIRSDSRYKTLYRSVLQKANSGDKKCAHFIEELSYYRDICITTPVSLLIDTIYDRTGYQSIVNAVSDTDMPANNLRLLKEYARDFESSGSKGLSKFVSYLNRMKAQGSDVKASIDVSATSLNAVRVMSIHASKGLEFPVCILANTNRKFSSDVKENVLLHSDYGIAVKHRDEVTNVSDTTMPRQALSLAIKRDEMSEELRVLYVAMTRAKQKLIMISTHKNVEKYLCNIASKIPDSGILTPYTIKNCSFLCEWIAMCALIHKDGKILREIAQADITPDLSVESPLEIKIIPAFSNILDDIESKVEEHIQTENSIDCDVCDILKERVAFEYKNDYKKTLPQKISASELSHKLSDKVFDRILNTPAFMSDSTLTPAQKGTALHAFMQFCDFKKAGEDIQAEINRLTESGYISALQAQSLDREKASRFIHSDIIMRCINSDEVFKEYRFAIKVNASLINEDISDDGSDEIILQGAVDLAFIEDGELVIVDYKTDRVKDVNELYGVYHNQLKIYRDAMEQSTDYKVKECLIYSVHLSDYIYI